MGFHLKVRGATHIIYVFQRVILYVIYSTDVATLVSNLIFSVKIQKKIVLKFNSDDTF